jgi:hypothetical protein
MTLEDKLKEWKRCNDKRIQLNREAETLKKRCDQLEQDFEKVLSGSKKDSVIRAGFTLCWVPVRSNVAWADEYLREMGPEKTAQLKNDAAITATRALTVVPPIG